MKVSLIVSTYNNPKFLFLTLAGALNQTRMPDEILVADDGSTYDTGQLVEQMAAKSVVPIRHIWHPDEGFRLAAIRNKAIDAAEGDYIIQIDGDIVLHPMFVSDHLRMARNGWFFSGSRVLLSEATTAEMIRGKFTQLPALSPERKDMNGFRFPLLMKLMRCYKQCNGGYVRGCNMAFWKQDLVAINGYNEAIQGWGREDSELSYRLINSGVKKGFIKFGAIEYHLYHPENSRADDAANIAIMETARKSGITRTPDGIVKGSGFK